MRVTGTYEALQADLERSQEMIELQSGQITELEYEVISLKSDNADLQALLVARDDEIYMLKEELESQRYITQRVINDVAEDPSRRQEQKELHEVKVDLAVTRIGCQWQQIIKDKNDLYLAQEEEEIARAKAQLDRSKLKLDLVQEELAATCLSADMYGPSSLPNAIQVDLPEEPRAQSPPTERFHPVISRSPAGRDALPGRLRAQGVTARPNEPYQEGVFDMDVWDFLQPQPVFADPVQLPKGMCITKKQLERARLSIAMHANLGQMLVVDASFTWKEYPSVGHIVIPTRRLGKTGWNDDSSQVGNLMKSPTKELLTPQGDRVSYVGTYTLSTPTKATFNELPEEARADILEKTICKTVMITPEMLSSVRSKYVSGELKLAVCELRRTGYHSEVQEILASVGGKW